MRRQRGAGAQQRAGRCRQRLRRRLALGNSPLAAAHLVGDLGRQLAALDHRPLVAVRGLPADDLDEGFARRRVLAELVGEEPPRLPEVGVGRAVGAVEELRGEVKVAVLPLVGGLVGLRGGPSVLRIAERGGDVARGERGAAQREMHARGEQRIHEAGGVADQHVPVAGERGGAVRPVALNLRFADQIRSAEQLLRVRRERNLRLEEAARAVLAQSGLANVLVDHRADAAHAGVQRNLPEPAVLVGLDEDVAVVGRVEMRCAAVVAVDREVLEERVPLLELKLAAENRRLPAGVDHEARRDPARRAIVQEADRGRPLALELDIKHLMAFAHVDTVGARVVEQNLVELRAHHLERGGALLGVVGEVPAPRIGVFAPDQRRAALGDEAGRLDRRHRAELFEHRNAGGQQRLADMLTRKRGALEQRHAEALIGEQRRAGGPARTAADHQHIAGLGHRS